MTDAGADGPLLGAPAEVVTVARAETPHGEVALRRRGAVLELVVDGTFAMDTVDTSTEVALAQRALRRPPLAAARARRRAGPGDDGARGARRPAGARTSTSSSWPRRWSAGPAPAWSPSSPGLEGERCTLHVADVLDVLAGRGGPRGPWDVVLLDVDNGPDFLVHASNAPLYAPPALAAARSALRPGGLLVVWSSHLAPGLLAALREVAGDGDEVTEDVIEVEREGRAFRYAQYSLARPPDVLTG